MQTEYTIRMTRQDAENILGNRSRKKIANNTYLHRYENGDIAMQLHSTDIVCWKPSGAIVLKTGGWWSHTTKDRLAMAVPIYQKDWTWYIGNGVPFYDYMVINKYGRILEGESSNDTL
jgi:hypothetical protein